MTNSVVSPFIKSALYLRTLLSNKLQNHVKQPFEDTMVASVHPATRIFARIEAGEIENWIWFWVKGVLFWNWFGHFFAGSRVLRKQLKEYIKCIIVYKGQSKCNNLLELGDLPLGSFLSDIGVVAKVKITKVARTMRSPRRVQSSDTSSEVLFISDEEGYSGIAGYSLTCTLKVLGYLQKLK